MRVIAGTARSLPLKTIEGLDTRPTTDRIKETLFNMLTGEVVDATFLDLFAGSGGIGIEALSRGAASCTFVEQAKNAVACIEDNLRFTKLIDKAIVRKFDAVSFVSSLPEINYDVIFMDPPYQKGLERRVLEVLSNKKFTEDTLIIVEAEIDEDFSYVDTLGFEITKDKRYKSNKHVFMRKKETL
ncbi:MAG: 16S rRNA (guanine(966)-N(2))-methyltransferase RsmD [Wujia sp.]